HRRRARASGRAGCRRSRRVREHGRVIGVGHVRSSLDGSLVVVSTAAVGAHAAGPRSFDAEDPLSERSEGRGGLSRPSACCEGGSSPSQRPELTPRTSSIATPPPSPSRKTPRTPCPWRAWVYLGHARHVVQRLHPACPKT